MATHFAKQRPCKGMAGFRFRTRTKSKYDKPTSENFLEQSKRQIEETCKRRGKSAGGTFLNPMPNLYHFCDQITPEEVKLFFKQLFETTGSEVQKNAHKSPLKEAIDFQEDVLRMRLASQNVQKDLEKLADQRLQSLVEGMIATPKIEVRRSRSPSDHELNRETSPITRNDFGMTSNLSSMGQSLPLAQHSSLAAVQSGMIGPPAIINRTVQPSRESRRQNLRVSAEGLIDIVTEEAQNSSRPIQNKKESLQTDCTQAHMAKEVYEDKDLVLTATMPPNEKGFTLLTPILTEDSHDGAGTKGKGDESPGTKLRSDSRQPYTTGALAPDDPPLNHDFQRKVSGLSKQLTQKSVQSKQTTRNVTLNQGPSPKLRPSNKATMSHENLRSTMTDRVMEPRCDNEDLRVISDSRHSQRSDEQRNYDSRASSKVQQRIASDQNFNKPEPRIKAEGTFKKRLNSAQNERDVKNTALPKRRAGQGSSFTSLSRGQAIKPNASGPAGIIRQSKASSKDLLAKTVGIKNVNVNTMDPSNKETPVPETKELTYLAVRASDESTAQQYISFSNLEGDIGSKKKILKQINTLMLSDHSQKTINMIEVASQQRLLHADLNLSEEALSQLVSQTSPPSVLQIAAQIRDHQTKTYNSRTEPQIVQFSSQAQVEAQTHANNKIALQKLLEEEIERIKAANRSRQETTDFGQEVAVSSPASPCAQLKFFEDTMKEHFKFGVNDVAMSMGRPILSTRQTYSTQLHQRVLENKIMETLKSSNNQEKLDEFMNAQQLAATMMDIVSSTASAEPIMLEPKQNMQNSFKEQHAATFAQFNQTLSVNHDLTLERNSPGPDFRQSRTPPHGGSVKRDSAMSRTLKYGQELGIMESPLKDYRGLLSDTRDTHQSAIRSPHEKVAVVPNQLNLGYQDNIALNLAKLNKQTALSRRQMMQVRDSRVDTLNQLTSPKSTFELPDSEPEQVAISPMELVMITQDQDNFVNKKPQKFQQISHQQAIRKPKTQGGGFNRTGTSGYYKSRANSENAGTESPAKVRNYTKPNGDSIEIQVPRPDSKQPVYVEDRPQIHQNEVWANQSRHMPMKLVFGIQRPVVTQLEEDSIAKQGGRNSSPTPLMNQISAHVSSEPHELNNDLPIQVRMMEVFPLQRRETVTGDKMTTSMDVHQPAFRGQSPDSRRASSTPTKEVIVMLPSDTSQQDNSSPDIMAKDRGSLRRVRAEHISPHQKVSATNFDGSLPGINERFSEGQQTASNINVIVDHRYSKHSKTHVLESTVQLRASSPAMVAMIKDNDSSVINRSSGEQNLLLGTKIKQSQEVRIRENNTGQEIQINRKERIVNSVELNLSPGRRASPGLDDAHLSKKITKEEVMVEAEADDHVRIAEIQDYQKQVTKEELSAVQEASKANEIASTQERLPSSLTGESTCKQIYQHLSSTENVPDATLAQPLTLQKTNACLISQGDSGTIDSNGDIEKVKRQRRSVLSKGQTISSQKDSGCVLEHLKSGLAAEDGSIQQETAFQRTDLFRAQLASSADSNGNQVLVQDSNVISSGEQSKILALTGPAGVLTPALEHNAITPVPRVNDSDKHLPQQKTGVKQRPQTTNPMTQTQNFARQMPSGQSSTQPRQVIFRNGQTFKSTQGANFINRSANLLPFGFHQSGNQVNYSQVATQNKDLQSIADSAVGNQNLDLSHNKSYQMNQTQQVRGIVRPQAKKKDQARLTFTQGVQQLIHNFDKKFIVNSMGPPKPVESPVVAQSMAIRQRLPSGKRNAGTNPQTMDNEQNQPLVFTQHSDMISDNKGTVYKHHVSQPHTQGVPTPHAEISLQGDERSQHQREMKWQKSQPSHRQNNDQSVTLVNPQAQRKSHTRTHTMDVSATQFVKHSPIFTQLETYANQPTQSGLFSPNSNLGVIKSQGALSTRPSMIQKRTQPTTEATSAVRLAQRARNSKHPLQFLAKAAIMNSREDLDCRRDGLIIAEQKNQFNGANLQISEQAQTILQSINSSRIVHASDTFSPKQVEQVMLNSLENEILHMAHNSSGESSLNELRRKQRHNRQNMLQGSAVIKPSVENLLQTSNNGTFNGDTEVDLPRHSLPSLNEAAAAFVRQSQEQAPNGNQRNAGGFSQVSRTAVANFKNQNIGRSMSVPRQRNLYQEARFKTKDCGSREAMKLAQDKSQRAINQLGNEEEKTMGSSYHVAETQSMNTTQPLGSRGRLGSQGHFGKPPLRGGAQQQTQGELRFVKRPPKSANRAARGNAAAMRNTQVDKRHLNLTKDDIQTLFKNMSATQKVLQKSTVLVQGTQLASVQQQRFHSGAGESDSDAMSLSRSRGASGLNKRRVQSGNPNTSKLQQQFQKIGGGTLSKRSSMLFNHSSTLKVPTVM